MRSKWKGSYVDPYLQDRIIRTPLKRKIKVFSRNSTILPSYKNKRFLVYNGKEFISLRISSDEMYYKKFGEYAITKQMGKLIHINKKKKKK